MLELKGKLIFNPINVTKKHNKQASWKKVAFVKFDGEDAAYYSWFLEKRFNLKLNKPLRGTHVTFINDIVNDEIYKEASKVFNNKEITIKYDPSKVRSSGTHWWINVESDDLKNIRSAMGLDPNPYYGLHMTLGLATHIQEDHSKYILRQCLKFNL